MINDISEVGEEVSLILVGKDCGHAGIVKFDIFIVNPDEVDSRVAGNERCESVRDDLRNSTL